MPAVEERLRSSNRSGKVHGCEESFILYEGSSYLQPEPRKSTPYLKGTQIKKECLHSERHYYCNSRITLGLLRLCDLHEGLFCSLPE